MQHGEALPLQGKNKNIYRLTGMKNKIRENKCNEEEESI